MKLSPIRRRSLGVARGAGRRRNKIPDHPLGLRRRDSHGAAIAAHRSSHQKPRVVEDAGHGKGREETRRAIHLASLRPRQQPRTRRRDLWNRVLWLRVLAAEGGPAAHRHRPETHPSHQPRLRGPISRAADREWKARLRRVP
jgi:hypothetical protein